MAPKGVKKTGLKEQMDPKEVSKMLGYLIYQASPKSKGDSESKSKAAIALSTYQKLAPDQKAGFLKKFASNRRDLRWVGEIADVESNSTQTKTSCHEWYCNMAEMFRPNGLGFGDVEVKNRLQTCLDFAKEAEDIHEYVADCIENANLLLTKWFYKKNNMKSVTDTYTTSATITERLT